jgi:hypothetical protein
MTDVKEILDNLITILESHEGSLLHTPFVHSVTIALLPSRLNFYLKYA